MPGYEYELAPDVPEEPQQLEALVEDADTYERVYQVTVLLYMSDVYVQICTEF